ncbi:MAG: hypothetical protein OXP09_02910 [Gammaproteobacteria bacterium]|nr:hypothetical protein [Gammaproteobacteria bacterium]
MNWLLFGWRRWLLAGLACCATIAAAYATPVRVPEAVVTVRSAPVDALSNQVAALAAGEDIGSLLASRRWGNAQPSARNPTEPSTPAPQSAPTINPELLKMNFVGLITVHDQRTVLLAVPNVGIERFLAGDTLPDGRVLVSVTDNSLTIKAEDLPEEELLLFPSIANSAQRAGSNGVHDQDVGAAR